MKIILTGKKDHGPRELRLHRRDFIPAQVETDDETGELVISMSVHVTTHIEGNYDMQLQLSKNEIAILPERLSDSCH